MVPLSLGKLWGMGYFDMGGGLGSKRVMDFIYKFVPWLQRLNARLADPTEPASSAPILSHRHLCGLGPVETFGQELVFIGNAS